MQSKRLSPKNRATELYPSSGRCKLNCVGNDVFVLGSKAESNPPQPHLTIHDGVKFVELLHGFNCFHSEWLTQYELREKLLDLG